MMATTDTTEIVVNPGEPFLTITREFDAPRALVFEAFTRPEHLVRWWGPRRLTTTVDKLDLRPGGEWRVVSRDLDGSEYGFRGVYREIVRPERLVWTFEFEGAPDQVSVEELTLEERGGKTLVTSVARYASVEARDAMVASGMESGLRESYQRMDELLAELSTTRRIGAITLTVPSDTEIVLTREFDAPRHLVWQAHVKPEHVEQWWGQRGSTLVACEMDVRPGGRWRYVTREADGQEYGFGGEYREIVPPERLVYTFEVEGMPGATCLETLTFVERDGKTTLTATNTFDSIEGRDGMLGSGMETGAAETWERLAEHLSTL